MGLLHPVGFSTQSTEFTFSLPTLFIHLIHHLLSLTHALYPALLYQFNIIVYFSIAFNFSLHLAHGSEFHLCPSDTSPVFCMVQQSFCNKMILEPVDSKQKKEPSFISVVITLIREAAWPYEIFHLHNRSQNRLFERQIILKKWTRQL